MAKAPTRVEIKKHMQSILEEWYDFRTGLYNITAVAEETAWYFGEQDEFGDPPERYFEIAEEIT